MQHDELERAARAAAFARAGARCECSDPLCTCTTHPKGAGTSPAAERCTASIPVTSTDADAAYVETSAENDDRIDAAQLVVLCTCCVATHRDTWALSATPSGE